MKVGWILAGNETTPSARIMGLNVIEYLNDNNICENIILHKPEGYDVRVVTITFSKLDVCVFQKVCWGSSQSIMREMKKMGIHTIYIVDDLTPDYIPMCREADTIVAGSEIIRSWIKSETGKEAIVMPDAYETPRDLYKKEYESDRIKVIWFGTIGHFNQAVEIKPIVEELGYEFITISSSSIATKQWSLDTIWTDIISSDIVVIPHLQPFSLFEKAKGNNRVTQSQVLGMPIIVSPLPAYLPLIEQGKTGFIAFNNDEEDWKLYLDYLKDVDIRREIGQAAREAVIDKFHISEIGRRWKEILHV